MLWLWIVLGLVASLLVWFLIAKSRRKTHPVEGGLHENLTLPHEASLELYSNAFSHCSRKTRLVMAELQLQHTHKPIDLIETGSYETLSPRYLKINPSGLVPTLVHDGHPIYESDDIMAYAVEIAEADAPKLTPDDETQHKEMQRWIDFCSLSSADPMGEMKDKLGACVPGLTLPLFVTTIAPIPLFKILEGFLFHPDKGRPFFFMMAKLLGLKGILGRGPALGIIHAARDAACKHLETVEAELKASKTDWLLGENFTLADITFSCVLLRMDETGWLNYFEETLKLEAIPTYYKGLRARPSWQEAIIDVSHPAVEKGVQALQEQLKENESLRGKLYG